MVIPLTMYLPSAARPGPGAAGRMLETQGKCWVPAEGLGTAHTGANGVSPAASPPPGPPEPARAAPKEERAGGYNAPPARDERPARPPGAPQPPAPLRQPPPEEEEEDANSYDSDEGSAYPGVGGCVGLCHKHKANWKVKSALQNFSP